MRGALAVFAVMVSAANPAAAMTAVSPTDGALVGSRPSFRFDFIDGAAAVQWSRAPDVRANGAFVDQAGDTTAFWTGKPTDGVMFARDRFDSGLWYWSFQTRGEDDEFSSWSPPRTFRVEDEFIEVDGMTAIAQRLRPVGDCARVRLRGVIAWDDNDPASRARLEIGVASASESADVSVRLESEGRYDVVTCVAGTRLRLAPAVVDRIGQLTDVPGRSLTVDRGLRVIPARAGSRCLPVRLFTRANQIRQTGTSCRRARQVVERWMAGSGPRIGGYTCAQEPSGASLSERSQVECRSAAGRILFRHSGG